MLLGRLQSLWSPSGSFVLRTIERSVSDNGDDTSSDMEGIVAELWVLDCWNPNRQVLIELQRNEVNEGSDSKGVLTVVGGDAVHGLTPGSWMRDSTSRVLPDP